MWQWLSDLWNLSRILDKYIPRVKRLMEDEARLELKLDDLRQSVLNLEKDVKRLKSPIPMIDPEPMVEAFVKAKLNTVEKAETVKEEPKVVVNENPPKLTESRITKVNRYYDPQMGVEYLDFEINGDKASSEDDTVRE